MYASEYFWYTINKTLEFFISQGITSKVKFLFVMHFYRKLEKYKNSSWYMNFEFSENSWNFQNRKTEFSL